MTFQHENGSALHKTIVPRVPKVLIQADGEELMDSQARVKTAGVTRKFHAAA